MGKVFDIIASGILIAASYFFPPLAPLFLMAANYYMRQAFGPQLPQMQHWVQTSAADPTAGVPVVYGTVRVGLRLTDIRVNRSYADWRSLWIVGAVCHGSQDGAGIMALDDIWFDQYQAFDNAGNINSRYVHNGNHFAWLQGKFLGTDGQSIAPNMTPFYPAVYTANHMGRSLAIVIVELIYHQDLFSGVPNINVQVRGCRVYDPRDATWKFSDNPALCVYDYLTSTRYGLGVPAGEIDAASFQACANYCDEMVNSYSGGPTLKRFTCNGVLDTNQSPKDNLGILLGSCRGLLTYEGGKFRMIIRRPITQATLTLDRTNILGDWSFSVPGAREAVNIMRARYVDKNNNWQVASVQFPEPGAANGYLTDDNGFENAGDVDLPMVTNKYTAQQIAMTMLRESRSGTGVQVTCTEAALQLQVGDLVPVTHETPGWTAKLFWVVALELLEQNQVRCTLVEYQSSAYTLDLVAQDPGNPGTDLPNPFAVPPAPTGLTLTADGTTLLQTDDATIVPRIKATWSRPDTPFMDYVEVWAKRGSDPWNFFAKVGYEEAQQVYISGVREGDSWTVQIRSVTTLNVRSAWVTSAVVVAADLPDTVQPFYGNGRDDLVFNGQFEDGGTAYWGVQNQTTGQWQVTWTRDTSVYYLGTGSVRMDCPASDGVHAVFLHLKQVPNALLKDGARTLWVKVNPNDVFTLEGFVRFSAQGTAFQPLSAGVYIQFWDAARSTYVQGGQANADSYNTGAGVWARLSARAVVPAGRYYATITFYGQNGMLSAGSIWWDNISCSTQHSGYKKWDGPLMAAMMEPNAINNGNFEDGFCWWAPGGTGSWSMETSTQYAGTKSLKLVSAGDNTNTYAAISTRDQDDASANGPRRLIRCAPGDLIRFRCAMKAGASSGPFLQAAFYDANGSNPAWYTPVGTTSTSWVLLDGQMVVPPGKYMCAVFCIIGGGTVQTGWFDEVRVDINPPGVGMLYSNGNMGGVTTATPMTYSVPAGTLWRDGMALKVRIQGHSVNGTANLTLLFGGQTVLSKNTQNGDVFDITVTIRRGTGATAEVFQATCLQQLTPYALTSGALTVDLTAAQTLSFYTSGTVTCTVDHMDVQVVNQV